VAVSHKLLCAILSRVASIQGNEVLITHEQGTEVSGTSAPNVADFMVGHVTQHLSRLLVSSHVVPIEAKALQQGDKDIETLQRQAIKQVLGHLSSSIRSAFLFGGIGIDCIARGAVLTLVSVEILELHLKDAGTSKAKLVLRRSGNYPLFSEAATKNLLPTLDYKGFFNGKTPSDGFRILARLMSPVDRETPFPIQGCWYNHDGSKTMEDSLVKLLGTGTFSNVYKLSSDRSFLKVPKNPGFDKALEIEKTMLRRLNNAHIPTAPNELGFLNIHLRCEASMLRCLKLDGDVGTSASKFEFVNDAEVVTLCNQVMKALNHAHSKGIVHMDVRPSNIVLSCQKDGSTINRTGRVLHVQLVDWGAAADIGVSLQHFRGCIPYAHDYILTRDTKKRWMPAPRHDYASLAYTLATIKFRMKTRETRVPWSFGFFRDRNVDQDALAARNDIAEKRIMELPNFSYRKMLVQHIKTEI
jgi:hypothetical protein